MRDVIYIDGEIIIGYSDDIARDIFNDNIDDDLCNELANKLDELDSELVYITYHPSGAYTCRKLEIGKELFVV